MNLIRFHFEFNSLLKSTYRLNTVQYLRDKRTKNDREPLCLVQVKQRNNKIIIIFVILYWF